MTTAAAALAGFAGMAGADTVKIAVVVGQTGTYAFVGDPLVKSIQMAMEKLTAEKAFGDHTVEITYDDNRSDKQEAIALITRKAAEGYDMIIGPIASAEGMAAGPVAVEQKIPMFTTATTPEVLKIGEWIFKSTETADAYMVPVAEHVASLKPASCFLVSIRDNEGYVRQKNVFSEVVTKAGIKVLADESILAADTDFTALATKVVDADPDCLFVTAPPEQAANIIIQIKQAGLDPDTILASDSGAGAQKFLDAGGSAVEGTIFPATFVPELTESSRAFSEAYKAKYGKTPDNWAATGDSMMQVVASAIRNAGTDVTRESLRAALAATKDVPVVIGQGKMSFDADRVPHVGGIVMKVEKGSWVAAK
jgi:branched-chain amino acid transport system substrate-binding protein